MSWNSVGAYGEATLRQLQEAAGVTQFPAADAWYQLVNGLLVQGGRVSIGANASLVVPFLAPIPSQLLGVFTQSLLAGTGNGYSSIDSAGTNLTQFTLVNTGAAKDYYWWAIGV